MGSLGRCSRAVFNLLPLRGRKRRMAKLLFLLLLSGGISMLIFSGNCLPGIGRCGGEVEEEGGRVEVIRQESLSPRDYVQPEQQIPLPRLHNIKDGADYHQSDPVEKVMKEEEEEEEEKEKEEEEEEELPEPFLEKSTIRGNRNKEMDHQKGTEQPHVASNMAVELEKKEMKGNKMEPRKTVKSDEERRGSEDKSFKDDKRPNKKNNKIQEPQPNHQQHQVQEVVGDSQSDMGGRGNDNGENAQPIAQSKGQPKSQPKGQQANPTVGVKKRDTATGSDGGDKDLPQTVEQKPKKSSPKPTAPKIKPISVNTDPHSKPKMKPEDASKSPEVIANPKEQGFVVEKKKKKGGELKATGKSDGVKVVAEDGQSVEEGRDNRGGGGVQEEKQMSAVEMAKAIESGEMCKTVCPPFTWSEWSPCSKACGKGRRYRKALYKFVCQTSELCPLNRIEEAVCDTPCKFDPEKYGGRNGLDMYPINPLNPAIYPEDKNYMCGHWLVEYERLHQEILSGKRPPRYLVYSTGKGTYPTAGGIAPRIRGITTAFFLAVLLDRAFMIDWQDPPGLDLYLEPKSFNWADLSKMDNLKRGPVRDIGSWRSAKESSISSQWYMSTNFSTYFTNEVEVVQGHRYDFTYAVLRNPELMPKAFELGVDRIKCRICCAFHMLFKMTEKFEAQMDELLQSLGAPQKTIGAIQVRAKSNNVQEAVKHVESFIKCATKAAKGLKLTKKISWVPIFNNRLVVHIVHKKYGDKLKIPINIDSATRTVHTHLGNLPADTELEVAKAVQERTFKEFFLAVNSTVLIRKKGYEGSFGNIADAIRRFYHKLGTVQTFLVGNTCSKFPDTYKIE